MKTPPLWQVTILTTSEAEDAVGALMERVFRQTPSIYTNFDTQASLVTVFSKKPTGALTAQKKALGAGLKEIAACGLRVGEGTTTVQKVPREDWAESWKKYFKTIEIGRALLIRPSWSKRKPRKNQAVVTLDPGLSFGTGQHPTTSFCLEQIVELRKEGVSQSFLDMGCGSGILGICAAKLGYKPVKGFDFDPVAVRVAKANCADNGAEKTVSITRQDLTKLPATSPKKWDLVCANLIHDLLKSEQAKICDRLAPTGTLVLAGILATQFEAVAKTYEKAGLKLVKTRTEREWQSGSFVWRQKTAGG